MNDLHSFSPRAVRWFWTVFAIVLAVSVLAEVFIHRHAAFGFDGFFSFNALYGFITCVIMVGGAVLLGKLLKRRDTYYDD